MRQLKEIAEEEAGEEDDDEDEEEEDEEINIRKEEDADDTMRMSDRPEANPAEPWMASFGKYGSPALDRIPHSDTPNRDTHSAAKRPAPNSPEKQDDADTIQEGLIHLQGIVDEAVVEGSLMNNHHPVTVLCVRVLTDLHGSSAKNPMKMAGMAEADLPPPAVITLPPPPPKMVVQYTDTPCWWPVAEETTQTKKKHKKPKQEPTKKGRRKAQQQGKVDTEPSQEALRAPPTEVVIVAEAAHTAPQWREVVRGRKRPPRVPQTVDKVALLKKRVPKTSAVIIDHPIEGNTIAKVMQKVADGVKLQEVGTKIISTRSSKAGGIIVEVDAAEGADLLADLLGSRDEAHAMVLLLGIPQWKEEEAIKNSLIQAGVAPQELVHGGKSCISLRTNPGNRGARVAKLDLWIGPTPRL